MKLELGALVALTSYAGSVFGFPASSSSSSTACAPVVKVKNGTYAGVHSEGYNQDFFLGVPYAQPPVGDLRFRIPQSLDKAWNGTKNATTYSKECVGYGSDQWNYEISEDCLYLNVVRPSGYENQSLPVAFWIHGGGYYEGGAPDMRYNLSFIVQNGVDIGKPFIAVSTNYRLSGWGFLMGDAVQEAGQTNMGLRDQRLALHWLQENIAAFGGDPTKVTIWGESAGGSSVGFHLTAYTGRDDGLFRAAMMESGGPVYYGALANSTGFEAMYTSLLSKTNCTNATDTLACLRAAPFTTLNAAFNTTALYSWGPTIDGDFITGLTSLQLAAGEFVHVPILAGANSDEGTAFAITGINSTTALESAITSRTGCTPAFATLLARTYPLSPPYLIPASPPLGPLPATYEPGGALGTQYRRSAALFGDYVMVANRRLNCETWAAAGVPAYCYRFNAIPAGLSQDKGVTHFQEVAFVFDNLAGLGYAPAATPPFEGKPPAYAELAKLMSRSWVSFVVGLDPNAWEGRAEEGVEAWPDYGVGEPRDFVFDANVTSYAERDVWRQEGIALINAHAADMFSR